MQSLSSTLRSNSVSDSYSDLDEVIKRWPTREARAWVGAFLDRAERSQKILAVVALGSSVRPAVPSEDLDLLVLHTDGADLDWRPPIEIDLRSYDASAIERELAAGADLATWCVRFGLPLFERDDAWTRLVEAWGERLRLPDPDTADQRAEQARRQLSVLEEIGDEGAANEVRVSYLTHRARAALSRSGIFPASRPELGGQLRSIGEVKLANALESALAERRRLASESTAV